jgi:hypothetical protein
VLDVTHPAFATPSDADIASLSDEFVAGAAARSQIPAAVRDALMQSRLGRAIAGASGSHLGGMDTYLLKLGPDHLWPGASEIDRRIAGSFPAVMARVRVRDMAMLMAEALGPLTASDAGRPVSFVNIAGGAGADSWNAMLLLQAADRPPLAGRRVFLSLCDADLEAPSFGARAVAILSESGAPLHGVDVTVRQVAYDWGRPAALAEVFEQAGGAAASAVSSEGGLYEYGSDDEILENLRVVREHTAPDAVVVGSVTRDGEPVRASGSGVATRPRTLESFCALAEHGGWRLARSIDRPFSFHVRLVKA